MDFRSHVALGSELSFAVSRTITSSNGSGKTKISDFKIEIMAIKNVLWLQISVSNTFLVDIIKTIEELSEVETSSLIVESSSQGYIVKKFTASG